MLGEFEKDPLLRIDDFGLERADPEERCIEQVCAVNQPASANVVRIVAQAFLDAGAKFLWREE